MNTNAFEWISSKFNGFIEARVSVNLNNIFHDTEEYFARK